MIHIKLPHAVGTRLTKLLLCCARYRNLREQRADVRCKQWSVTDGYETGFTIRKRRLELSEKIEERGNVCFDPNSKSGTLMALASTEQLARRYHLRCCALSRHSREPLGRVRLVLSCGRAAPVEARESRAAPCCWPRLLGNCCSRLGASSLDRVC